MFWRHLEYLFIRAVTYPIAFLPYRSIRHLGNALGWIAFYCFPEYRKRTLSNLSLARDLSLSREELYQTAKQSFQNLAINLLEYPKLAREKNLAHVIQCDNPEVADALYKQGKGLIFFCSHQANWEVLFLDGTSRMRGIAIGKPIKNPYLYRWIVSIREKMGGTMITPRNALREGLKQLRKGTFLGIVGDQGMPESGYAFPFFGRRAWTSTAPALLAYKTNSPLIFATTRRVPDGYRIHYSDPIWPDLTQPLEKETIRLMDQLLMLQQQSVRERPGEWLWQHNRWKQGGIHGLYKRFRQDSVCAILPPGAEEILPMLRQIYPTAFLFLIVPKGMQVAIKADELFYYETMEETLLDDLRFKLVFNFTAYTPINAHYKQLSALYVLQLLPLPELLPKTLCRVFEPCPSNAST